MLLVTNFPRITDKGEATAQTEEWSYIGFPNIQYSCLRRQMCCTMGQIQPKAWESLGKICSGQNMLQVYGCQLGCKFIKTICLGRQMF